MNVNLAIQLGLLGTPNIVGDISLDVSSVGNASSWAGSYHVLAMGRHYDSYVITGDTLSLPPIAGFPATHPYLHLTAKIRAPSVTGNIGESVAALFARRCMGAQVRDIALVNPRTRFKKRQYPDYLMRLKNYMPGLFSPILPTGVTFQWPDWWPVESKARTTAAATNSAKREALQQLVTYWSVIAGKQPDEIGYGMIASFTYNSPYLFTVNLLLPKNQSQLVEALDKEGDKIKGETLRVTLYGC